MRTYTLSEKIFSIMMIFLVLINLSCADKQEEIIPYRNVDFDVALNLNNNLTTTGFSMIYPNEGYGGVIIYCAFYDYSAPNKSIYYAYDATCTNEVSDSCSVRNEGNSFYGECPCCHSKYEFTTGNPIEGQAFYPLKRYKNISVYNNELYVRN